MPLAYGHGRIAADGFPFLDVADDPALTGDTCATANMQMVADADLPPDHDAVADDSTAGNAHLAADDTAASDPDIVCNMYEVIENRSCSDHRITGRTTVYRAVRTYFDVVFDDDTAQLRNTQPPIPRRHETETLSADADTGRDSDSSADDGVTDATVCPDGAVIAKNNAAADDGVTSDVTTTPDFCTGTNNGPRVNS